MILLMAAGPGLPQQISHVLTHPSHGAFLGEASGTLWAWQSGHGSCRQLHRGKLPKHCTQAVLAPADAPDAAGSPCRCIVRHPHSLPICPYKPSLWGILGYYTVGSHPHSASGFWPKLRFSIVWALQAGHRRQSTAVATMADAARRKPSYLEYSMPRQWDRQVAHRLGAGGCSSSICFVIESEQARISAGLHPACKVFEGTVACAADTAHPSDPLHGVCLV